MEAYDIYSTGSLSARGGTAIYVNKIFNSFDESVWIEINIKGFKGYYLQLYLEKCMRTLTKE